MGTNLILICVGLVICFGGIYFRKICAGIMGFIWGMFVGVISVFMMALMSGGIWAALNNLEEASALIIVWLFAIGVAVLSAWLDRLCAAINIFFGGFFVIFLIMAMMMEDIEGVPTAILLSLAMSGVLAWIGYTYYNYGFICATAFTGAFMASVGGNGLMKGLEPSEVLINVLFYGDSGSAGFILVGTLILGVVGFNVQLVRLKGLGSQAVKSSDGLNHLTENIVNGAKIIGENTTPHLKDMGAQAKCSWNDLNTEQGREELKDDIMNNKELFVVPLIVAFGIPVINYMVYNSAFLYSLYPLINSVSVALGGIMVGTLIYLVVEKNMKFVMAFNIPYIVGYLIFNFRDIEYVPWGFLIMLLKFIIISIVLYVISGMVRQEKVKLWILSVTAFFMDAFVIYWIAYSYMSLYVNFSIVLKCIVVLGTVYYLFRKYRGINILG